MKSAFGKSALMVLLVLFGVTRVHAQINLYGLNLSSTGDFTVGYTGDFGDTGQSSHSLFFGGDGYVNGYYYTPNFLSFTVQPFYERSQANSEYQSLTNSRGVNSSVNVFGGSHFPGFLSYTKNYNSTGQFGVPGSSGILTHGNSDSMSVNWSALFPNLPSFNFSYSVGSGTSTIYDLNDTARTSQRNLSLRSNYLWRGFRLDGGFTRLTTNAYFPSLTSDGDTQISRSWSKQFQFTMSHALPMTGSVSTSYSHNIYSNAYGRTDSTDTSMEGTSNNINSVASIHPTRKLTLTVDSTYTDNAIADYTERVIEAGGQAPFTDFGKVRSFRTGGTAYYALTNNLFAQGNVSHQEQRFLGQDYSATQFGGSLNFNFSRPLFGGLSASIGAVDSATEDGNSGLGFVGSLNYTRRVGRWNFTGNYIYAQNVQTMLVVYTTSNSSYSGGITRKIGDKFTWFGNYSGYRSGITQVANSGSHSDRISTSLIYRRYTVTGFVSRSEGQSVLTPTGLVNTPTLPPDVLARSGIVFYNADAHGFTLSAQPLHRITITAGYSRAKGRTTAFQSPDFLNDTEIVNMLARYQFRKLYFDAGYTRFRQGVGRSVTDPAVVSSYFFGLSRWFNIF